MAADLDQPVEGDAVPFLHVVVFVGNQGQLCGRVVDQGSQVIPVPLGHGGAEKLVQLVLDLAGAGVQDMQEGFVLTVDVGHEMLGALGQVQNSPQVDDLRARRLNGGVLFGKQPQIVQLFGCKGALCVHR